MIPRRAFLEYRAKAISSRHSFHSIGANSTLHSPAADATAAPVNPFLNVRLGRTEEDAALSLSISLEHFFRSAELNPQEVGTLRFHESNKSTHPENRRSHISLSGSSRTEI